MAEPEQKIKLDLKKSKSDTFDFLTKSAVFSVFVGGFLGTVARTFIFIITPTAGADIFVNIVGSFLIGFLMFLPAVKNEMPDIHSDKLKLNKRLFIGTGFLGGFTTFSYFMLSPFLTVFDETAAGLTSIMTGSFMIQYLIYVTFIILIGIFAAFLGKYCAEKMFKNKDKNLKGAV